MGRGTHRGFITYEELSKSLGKRNLSGDNLSQAFIHILDENISLVEKKSDFKVLRKKENSNKDEGKTRFRLHARPKYPPRTFTTSSAFIKNYYLPTTSYWGLKDENTEEMVVDFDTNYTQISCDATSSFFDIHMDGLEPERYYRLLVKTVIDGSDVIVDDDQIFKITRNG